MARKKAPMKAPKIVPVKTINDDVMLSGQHLFYKQKDGMYMMGGTSCKRPKARWIAQGYKLVPYEQ